MPQGRDVLIFYDAPSKHAVVYLTMSLLLEKSATDLSQQKEKIKMHQGNDILIIHDAPSKHAVAYRTMSFLLKKSTSRFVTTKSKN